MGTCITRDGSTSYTVILCSDENSNFVANPGEQMIYCIGTGGLFRRVFSDARRTEKRVCERIKSSWNITMYCDNKIKRKYKIYPRTCALHGRGITIIILNCIHTQPQNNTVQRYERACPFPNVIILFTSTARLIIMVSECTRRRRRRRRVKHTLLYYY